MNSTNRIIAVLLAIAGLTFLGWYFFDILIYVFIAIILSVIGSPVMRLLDRVQIKGRKIPQSIAAIFTLILLILGVGFLFYLIVPAVTSQIMFLSSIDLADFTLTLNNWLYNIDQLAHQYQLIPDDKVLSSILVEQGQTFIGSINYSAIVGNVFSFGSSLFILCFSVVFFTYYSLKDKAIFFKMSQNLIPNFIQSSYTNILTETRSQVKRYFRAVIIDNLFRGILVVIGCWIFDIPNPIFHGVLAGVFNIIPYIGTVIAYALSILVAITSTLTVEAGPEALSSVFLILTAIYAVTKVIDTFLLQPYLFGKSVKAHPIEIFIVILAAGNLGGVLGMILAVPAYSLIRIVVHEFFGLYFGNNKEKDTDALVEMTEQTEGKS